MTDSSCDFPAAHSMDTTWFAVDAEGYVGVFESGEPGAVPKLTADTIGSYDDPMVCALEDLDERAEPSFQTSAVVHPGLRKGTPPPRRRIPAGWPAEGQGAVLLFEDKRAIPAAVRALPEVQVRMLGKYYVVALRPHTPLRNDHPQAVVWNEFVRSTYHDDRLVTSARLGIELVLARRGVFAYKAHDARFHLPEPYGRVLRPPEPLHLRDAPKRVRDELSQRPRLDVSFAASRYVQPADLVPCVTWSSAIYLAADGCTVRALEGREAAYEDEAGNLEEHEDYEPLVFDAP